jgi:hypothetical protein
MNIDVSPLDLIPADEATAGGPELISSCCSNCYSSMAAVTNGCEW